MGVRTPTYRSPLILSQIEYRSQNNVVFSRDHRVRISTSSIIFISYSSLSMWMILARWNHFCFQQSLTTSTGKNQVDADFFLSVSSSKSPCPFRKFPTSHLSRDHKVLGGFFPPFLTVSIYQASRSRTFLAVHQHDILEPTITHDFDIVITFSP